MSMGYPVEIGSRSSSSSKAPRDPRLPERRRTARLANVGAGARMLSANMLTGARVLTRDGVSIGSVGELMLDVQRGRIAYVVVAHGGFMGLGERLHAIPWSALGIDPERRCLVLAADRATFLAAPGFDKDHWPETPDAAWHHALHRHYGCRPYWE
jgi:sporulation protein YlmC with PRC-barrel domain